MSSPAPPPPGRDVAVIGGGCFWCTDAVFSELRGVDRVLPGYAGGTTANPTYEEVCSETTGHAEVVEIVFDPAVLPYDDLLRIFFTTHDPTTLNRQGNDVGTSYRSIILYRNAQQKEAAARVMAEVQRAGIWRKPLVTEVAPLRQFYPAEEYHRDYFRRNPGQGYCAVIIAPKVAKFRKQYAERLKRA
jgi:peptide-methionine (S)-S-oxide reductase